MTDTRVERILTGVFCAVLAGIVAYAGLKLMSPATPALIAAGLGLCAGAPLAFLLRPGKSVERQHPVLISSLCGLGCVMIMVGIQRFGDEHQSMLVIAALVLIGWMAYQRKVLRAGDSIKRPSGGDSE